MLVYLRILKINKITPLKKMLIVNFLFIFLIYGKIIFLAGDKIS